MALTAHALQAVQFRLKSVSNEGHFTLEAESVSHPYLPPPYSGRTEVSYMAHKAKALTAVQVTLRPVSKKRHFTMQHGRVTRPYVHPYFSGVTEI
jgi:hypothetical protein